MLSVRTMAMLISLLANHHLATTHAKPEVAPASQTIGIPAPTPMQGTCSDKDGGDVPGTASYAVDGGGAWFVDSCNGFQTQEFEKICNGYFVTQVTHNCTCVFVTITIPGYGNTSAAKCQ